MQLAQMVSAARKRRGWSQTTLAENARVSKAVVSRIESGKSIGNAQTLYRIAAVLGLDNEQLGSVMRPTVESTVAPATDEFRDILIEVEQILNRLRTLERRLGQPKDSSSVRRSARVSAGVLVAV